MSAHPTPIRANVPVLTDWDEIPTGPHLAYHETRLRNRDDILRAGIRPMDRGPAGSEVDALLQEHGDATDPTRPEHRSNCAFLYADHSRAANPAEEVDCITMFVIDLTEITNPIYTACYDTVTELYGVAAEEDVLATVRQYWDSCRPFEPGDESEGELLVDGGVPADAITHRFNPHAE